MVDKSMQIRRQDIEDIAILKSNYLNMNDKIESWFKEIKMDVKEINEKLGTFIDKAKETFATKEDHKENSNKIWELKKVVDGINLKIAIVTWGFSVVIFIAWKIWS